MKSNGLIGERVVYKNTVANGQIIEAKCKQTTEGFADFEAIHKIIEDKYGTDITEKVRGLTEQRYGINLSQF